MICPYCQGENAVEALACIACSRDIAVPQSLLAERDELIRRRDALRNELTQARDELEQARRGKKRRLA